MLSKNNYETIKLSFRHPLHFNESFYSGASSGSRWIEIHIKKVLIVHILIEKYLEFSIKIVYECLSIIELHF